MVAASKDLEISYRGSTPFCCFYLECPYLMNKSLPIFPQDLKLYTLSNSRGISVEILNLGASVFNLTVPDKFGNPVNVAVGPKNKEDYLLEDYPEENRCFGSSVGRYAGRISYGRFSINGENFQLYEQDGVHLHGGQHGLQHKLWDLESLDNEKNVLCFSCNSSAGEEGYPGNLKVQVTYSLTGQDTLEIEYKAIADKPSPVNLTNHTYFNLDGSGSIRDHSLFINAANILEVDNKQRPTGKFEFLKGHSKNFSSPREIKQQEVDDTFVLEKTGEFCAALFAAKTGIQMQVKTNQPAVVIYIPRELPRKWEYKNELLDFPSICIETQNFPDAPNHDHFPSSILQPGEEYKNISTFKFSIAKEAE